jgi:hypothetical protein
MLYELVYLSTSVPIDIGQGELERILASSRTYNRAHGITGVLLYENSEFVQLLEGERDAVLHLYHERIVHDTRHRGVHIAMEQPVLQRGCADWAMGFFRLSEVLAAGSGHPEGYLAGGIASLDFSSPQSDGLRFLLAVHEQMRDRI